MKNKHGKINGQILVIAILLILLIVFEIVYPLVEQSLYHTLRGNTANISGIYNLHTLTLEFLTVALIACLISTPIGFLIGLFCHSKWGESFQLPVEKFATVINTVPTIAVLYLVVNISGFGIWPSVTALVTQAILPVLFATISGIGSVSPVYIDAARGIGMNSRQILWKIQIPLAFPVILSGIKASLILCVSAAILAANTGGGGLGRMIYGGYATYNYLLVFEGTVPIVLIALLVEATIKYVESVAWKRTGTSIQ